MNFTSSDLNAAMSFTNRVYAFWVSKLDIEIKDISINYGLGMEANNPYGLSIHCNIFINLPRILGEFNDIYTIKYNIINTLLHELLHTNQQLDRLCSGYDNYNRIEQPVYQLCYDILSEWAKEISNAFDIPLIQIYRYNMNYLEALQSKFESSYDYIQLEDLESGYMEVIAVLFDRDLLSIFDYSNIIISYTDNIRTYLFTIKQNGQYLYSSTLYMLLYNLGLIGKAVYANNIKATTATYSNICILTLDVRNVRTALVDFV